MSDDEDYEYEYDEDGSDEEMADDDNNNNNSDDDDEMAEDNSDEEEDFEYTDDEPEADDADVALENAYYNAKGLRDQITSMTDDEAIAEAVEGFEGVITMERQQQQEEEMDDGDEGGDSKYGPWSYKAIKQLVKLTLRTCDTVKTMEQYDRLLKCVSSNAVSPNAVEKGVNGMLERVSSLYQGSSGSNTAEDSSRGDPKVLARNVYDATLKTFHPKTGSSPNERLWFKTNLKYGQLLYEMNETPKLQLVIRDLLRTSGEGTNPSTTSPNSSSPTSSSPSPSGSGSSTTTTPSGGGSSTNLMEIYALQIQLYSRQKDNKKLREIFDRAMRVQGGIPHPRTLALIQELGGKMHMASREFEQATKTFFQAFKSYDEAGDPSRLRCLKYLVMASMLHASTVNPFDSQEARPYRDDPEIVAMTNLVQAFHNNEIKKFESILRRNEGKIMDDDFIREYLADLLRTIRTQVLQKVIGPYSKIGLDAIAVELNGIPRADVESLLVGLILDGKLDGRIDQVNGILIKKPEGASSSSNSGSSGNAGTALSADAAKGTAASTTTAGSSGGTDTNAASTTSEGDVWGAGRSVEARNIIAIEQLASALATITMAITSAGTLKTTSYH